MFALVISILVFGSVSTGVLALARPRLSAIEARIASLRDQVTSGQVSELALPFEERVLAPMAHGVGRVLSNFLPATFLAGIQRSLATAGLEMTSGTFVTVWAICAGLFSFLGLMAIVVLGGFSAQGLMGLIVLGSIGFLIPWMWLKSAVRSRQRVIVRALPDALDLVTTCVEAGLGLDAALGRVAEQMKGPLAGELSQTLSEISMGRLRKEALADLGARTAVEELISFVNAVIQAEQLGVSIAQVLKVQSDQMRTRRRQKAEQLAHEAAIKMIFPLVLFIFPAFMVVILGPAVINISQQIMR
jgi:tight adherence protein C